MRLSQLANFFVAGQLIFSSHFAQTRFPVNVNKALLLKHMTSSVPRLACVYSKNSQQFRMKYCQLILGNTSSNTQRNMRCEFLFKATTWPLNILLQNLTMEIEAQHRASLRGVTVSCPRYTAFVYKYALSFRVTRWINSFYHKEKHLKDLQLM